jgi:UPF0716 protein FxsA
MRGTQVIKWGILCWIALEIVAIVWVADLIGLGWTLLLILAGIVIGGMLLRSEGFRTMNLTMAKMRQGKQLEPADLAETPFVMLSAILFIIPGFITDVFGLLFFISPLRARILRFISKKLSARQAQNTHQQKMDQGRTYDGDFHRKD